MLFAPGTAVLQRLRPQLPADLLTVTYLKDLRAVLDASRVLRPMGIAADRVVWRTNTIASGDIARHPRARVRLRHID